MDQTQQPSSPANDELADIINTIQIGICASTIDTGKMIFMNDAFAEIYGWPKASLPDVATFFNCVYPDPEERKAIQERITADVQSGDTNKMIWKNITITTQAGEKRQVNATNLPLDQSNIMISTVTEVTTVIEKIKSQQDFLRLIFEEAPDGIYLMDMTGKFINGNKQAEELIGFKKEELIGKRFTNLSLLPLGQIPKALLLLGRIALGQYAGPEEYTLVRKDGTKKQVEIVSHPLTVNGQKFLLGIARDVSGRTQAEKYYKALFQNMSSGFAYHRIILDEKGSPVDYVFLEINESFEQVTGLKRDQIIGKRFTEVFKNRSSTDPDLVKEYGQVALSGVKKTLDFAFEPLNKHFSVDVFSPEPEYFVTIFNDISTIKETENKLREKIVELEKINQVMIGREVKMSELKEKLEEKDQFPPGTNL